jgi:pilus assembly protein CpaB
MEDLVGRVTSKFIPQGMPVTASMLAEDGTPAGIEELIDEGYRAVTVKIDESTGVAYLLRPRCYVDVIVVMDVKKSGRKSETISRVLLQRVKVGAVGQMLNEVGTEDGPSRVRSVTLIVPESDVPKLHLAQTKGRLTLAMRSTNDVLITEEAEAEQGELFGEQEQQAEAFVGPPAPPPALASDDEPDCKTTPAVVTVVNGGDVYRLFYRGRCSTELVGVQRGLTEGDSGATFQPAAGGSGGTTAGPRTLHNERDRRLRRRGAQTDKPDNAPRRDNDRYNEDEEVGE